MKSIKDDPGITGIGWNAVQNNIDCTAEQWEAIKRKKPEAKLLGKNKGLPNYDLMTDVFWDSGAQGAFARSSKESPLIDAEEREFGKRQMPSSPERSNPAAVAVGSDSTDNMDDHARLNSVEMVTSGSKRKLGSTPECDCSVSDKKLRIDTTRQMNEAAYNYNRRSKARLDDYLFRSARGDTTKADPPSMTTCLQLLEEACGDVPPSVSFQAYHKFKDPDFREAWVHWSTDMRHHLALTNFFDVLP